MNFSSSVSFPGVDQVYRRMFAEAYVQEPVSSWDGHTYVSASSKLEHGKTRAIFACDSRSYFAFEHLLGPVSAAWLNSRVLLDPGKFGHLGIAKRVLGAGGVRGEGVHIMLDYDDFNSQHSLDSQATVIRVLCEKTGYPESLARTLISSFYQMDLYVAGKPVGRAKGTLMSGHRGTTFLNSVLNAAYIRLACGSTLYQKLHALHVGDDVYLNSPTYPDAGTVLERTAALGCRMNPAKQSVGTVGAEFLRLGIRKTHAVGYLARAVASAVSGNWVNLATMAPREMVTSAITTTRALINRSQCPHYPALLARSLSRAARISRRVCESLLSGAKAIEGAPLFKSTGTINTYSLTRDEVDTLGPRLNPDWPKHASNDYLSNHATPVELKALELSGTTVRSAMLVSSYGKALAGNATDSRQSLNLKRCLPRVAVGSASATSLLTKPTEKGVLSGYALLTLIKSRLSNADLRELISMAGHPPAPSMLQVQAFGAPARSVVIQGVLSFSDAATLSSRTYAGVIYTTYPVYM
nr:MAG: RNA dependent RNA polymerase [Hanko toti-like virus 3]